MGALKAIRAWSNALQVQKTMTVNLEYQGKTIYHSRRRNKNFACFI